MNTKYYVLHITTHMGGGVGKVLSGIASYANEHAMKYQHRVLLLERPEKLNFIEICRAHGVEINIAKCKEDVITAMRAADIVQLEWWHHPLMAGFLADFPQEAMRLLIWSHISGCYYPCLPEAFLQIPMRFIFTSDYSFENPYWSAAGCDWAAEHCAMVNSSGGFKAIQSDRVSHDGFTIGYIGTQSYAKLHPDFVQYCKEVSDLPGVRFTMVGDKTNAEQILADAGAVGIQDKFCLIDYVSDVSREFAKMDVFGYLLNPKHFGTTENVLLEAMAAGLPVVCLDQCAERCLVKHGETGLLVDNPKEYREAIEFLYKYPEERQRLGENARRYVRQKFSVGKTLLGLTAVYDEVLQHEKRSYSFQKVFGEQPYEYFLACLPCELRQEFEANLKNNTALAPQSWPRILKEKSKSSLLHFCRTYPEDVFLQQWMTALLAVEKR